MCSGGRDLSGLALCELLVPNRPRVVPRVVPPRTVLAPRAWPALGQARVLLFDGHERCEKVVALETRAEQVGDRPGKSGGRASMSRAGRVRGGKQRPRGGGGRDAELRAATREAFSLACARCGAPRHRVARSPPARVVHPSVARQLDLQRAAPPRLGGLAMPCAAGHVHRSREAATQQGPSALHLRWWRSAELFRGQQPSVPAECAVKTCSRPWVAVWRACRSWCESAITAGACGVVRVAGAFSFLRWNCASAPRQVEPPWLPPPAPSASAWSARGQAVWVNRGGRFLLVWSGEDEYLVNTL